MHRLGDPQTSGRQQAKQGLVGGPAHWRLQVVRGGQQIDDLLLGVDVRRQALADAAEDGVVRHLGARFELLQPAGEGAQNLESPCPGCGIVAGVLRTARPPGHDLNTDRPRKLQSIHISGKAAQGVAHRAGSETKPVALIEELLDEGLHRGCGAHLASPGHGSATPAKLGVSSLA